MSYYVSLRDILYLIKICDTTGSQQKSWYSIKLSIKLIQIIDVKRKWIAEQNKYVSSSLNYEKQAKQIQIKKPISNLIWIAAPHAVQTLSTVVIRSLAILIKDCLIFRFHAPRTKFLLFRNHQNLCVKLKVRPLK